jgi:TRAP-type C4-dicarboxylate transport system permease small subunit
MHPTRKEPPVSENSLAGLRAARARFFQGLEAVLFVMVLTLLALVILQVFTRYVLQSSLPWTEEVARMVLVWLVMIGAAIATERKEQYAIKFIFERLRGRTRLAVLLLTHLLGIAFLLALMVYGAEYVRTNMQTVYVSTQLSKSYVYVAVPIGAAIMMATLVFHAIEAWVLRNAPPAAADSGTIVLDV